MATSPSTGPSKSKPLSLRELQTALYTACRTNYPLDKLLFQEDLVNLKVIPDNNVEILVQCAQALTNQNLFRIYTLSGRLAWKVVKEDDAAKYSNLTADEHLIYSTIDSSTTNGIWTKHIKSKTGLHQSIITRCLKSLETKCLVKTVRNVKHPSQKIYMAFGRQPNEDVTGGAWFTDGMLDEAFIQDLGQWVVRMVAQKSWVADNPEKGVEAGKARKPGTKGDVKGKGKEVEGDAGGKKQQHPKSKANTVYLPYPPGYTGYPTCQDITLAINESGGVDVEINPATMQQLLDVLCFDGRLVKVRGEDAYKSVRSPARLSSGDEESSLTDAPCGRCPVFSICEESGPINPGNCEYYQEWLEIF